MSAGRSDKGLRSRFAEADESPGLLLWQVTNRWQAAQRGAGPFDLTHVQFVLLASLTYLAARTEESVMQRDLADHAATDPMMTSQVLRALEQKGLIERRDHPHDRRAKALVPTETGATLVNRALAAVEDCDSEFFAPLGAHGRAFAGALTQLRDRTTR